MGLLSSALIVCLASTLGLAGCLAGPADDAAAAPRPTCGDDASSACPSDIVPWRYSDCRLHGLHINADRASASEFVPPPYGMQGFVGAVDAELGFFTYHCEAIVFDNVTVVEDARWAITFVQVIPPDNWTRTDASNWYVLEYFVENQTHFERLQDAGMDPIFATFDTDDQERDAVWRVQFPGGQYEVNAAQHPQASPGLTYTFRWHRLDGQSTPYLLDERLVDGDSQLIVAQLVVTGGVLSEILVPTLGPLTANGPNSEFSGEIIPVEQISGQ